VLRLSPGRAGAAAHAQVSPDSPRPRRLLTPLLARYGQKPLGQALYEDSLEVYEYLYEGDLRTAGSAARKAVEFVRGLRLTLRQQLTHALLQAWLTKLPHFEEVRVNVVRRVLTRRMQARMKRDHQALSAIAYADDSDEDETPEGVWNESDVRDTVRRECLYWYGRHKLFTGEPCCASVRSTC